MNLPLKLFTATSLFMMSNLAISASMMDDFIDPQDGMFDTSHWLAEKKGFFPSHDTNSPSLNLMLFQWVITRREKVVSRILKQIAFVSKLCEIRQERSTEFEDTDPDSKVSLTLKEVSEGCELTLVHTEIPEGQVERYKNGWIEHYFKPMHQYFSGL